MSFEKEIRGNYMCYHLSEHFTAASLVQLRTQIDSDIADTEYDVALFFLETKSVDNAGFKFFVNLEKWLEGKKRLLVFVGVSEDLQGRICEGHDFICYGSVLEFEQDFHEMNPKLYQTLYKLASGHSPVKNLKLQCPLCENPDVSGYILDTRAYKPTWSDNEITFTTMPTDDSVDYIDFSKYAVAVCPRCFFASSRLDWFTLVFDEGNVMSVLTESQIDSLGNHSSTRRAVVGDEDIARQPGFFILPRTQDVVFMAWALNEVCLKHISAHKKNLDGFDIAHSNLMMCKFAPDPKVIKEKLNTALAWLHEILNNPYKYATSRLAACYVYVVSIYLELGKNKEAREYYERFVKSFATKSGYDFYLNRVHSFFVDDEESK
jgi:hypothetical protein